MRQFIFKKCVFCLIEVSVFMVFAPQFVGCVKKDIDKKEFIATVDSIKTQAWTDTIIGSWYVRLNAPEPGDNPGIWEGPVEIGRKPGSFSCKVNTSLIKGVRQGDKSDIVIIECFNGSEAFEVRIDVDSCNQNNGKIQPEYPK